MTRINEYENLELITKYNNHISLWLVEDNSGKEFEILTIKVKNDTKNIIKRVLRNEVSPLVNQYKIGVQTVVRYDFDESNDQYYIVYENSQIEFQPITNFNKRNLLGFINTLNNLKKENRFGFIIHPDTLLVDKENNTLIKFVGLFEIFKAYNLLHKDYLSQEVLDNKIPKIQDDIYAIGKMYFNYLISKVDISKYVPEKNEERYSKYRDVLENIKGISEVDNDQNTRETIQVIAKEQEKFKTILVEMNDQCYWLLDSEKSEKREFKGEFATTNYCGRFFVNTSNNLFVIPYERTGRTHKKVIANGELANFSFSELSSSFIIVNYFEKQFEQVNELAELNKQHHNVLKKWSVLPKNEKKFIEDKAFKATYSKREVTKSNNQNIRFTLTDSAIDWKRIKELKSEKVIVSINDERIGEIQNHDPKENTLIIKDALLSIDEIPVKGELIQDVSEETSQYKKQEDACEQFKSRDIQNPEIASILATPEVVPTKNRIVLDYEGFKEHLFSENLKNDESQRDAVLEAINKKPIYLIQGPPGTGKTSVIVEMVEQLVNKNSNVKILITSQSNLAVDNVLERLPDHILYMRLVSDRVIDNDTISEELKIHLFNTKLQNWVRDTQEKSNTYIANKFGDKAKNKALINFYLAYQRLPKSKNTKTFLNTFYSSLQLSPNYIKRLFEKVNSKKDIDAIFEEELGSTYTDLIKIQQKWFAFIANATSDDGKIKKSMLNNGSKEIDLHTAYCKTINVFGGTCIHIASSKYRDIDFKFDYVIMDEASKATPAETLVPVTMAKNLVLIGDHKQLPPVITRETAIKDSIKEELDDNGLDFNKEFGISLFESLISAFEDTNSLHSYSKMLEIQYRMPRQLGDLISRHFYSDDPANMLKNPDTRLEALKTYDTSKFHQLKLKIHKIAILDTFTNTEVQVPSSILFITTSDNESPYDNGIKKNRNNPCNISVIKEVLETLNSNYTSNLQQKTPFNIGIIAGYRGQVTLLRNEIDTKAYSNFYEKPNAFIEINTVDQFQGAERDIIIYDIVRSSSGEDTIGFLEDYRRINVAFSRAKRLLIIVGDGTFILKRAKLHPKSSFNEFKLKNIVEELQQQNLIFNSLKDAINE